MELTHDELLEKITHHMLDIVQTGYNDYKAHKGLCAVVELAGKLQDEDPFHEDAGWNAGYNHAMYEVIQAITKELN